jgi:hypothetical protein
LKGKGLAGQENQASASSTQNWRPLSRTGNLVTAEKIPSGNSKRENRNHQRPARCAWHSTEKTRGTQIEPGTRSDQRAHRTKTELDATNQKRELERTDVSCWWEPFAHAEIEAHRQENTEQERGLARAVGSPPSGNRKIIGSCCVVGASSVKNQVRKTKERTLRHTKPMREK